jgi:hypothetical protein
VSRRQPALEIVTPAECLVGDRLAVLLKVEDVGLLGEITTALEGDDRLEAVREATHQRSPFQAKFIVASGRNSGISLDRATMTGFLSDPQGRSVAKGRGSVGAVGS